MQSRLVSVSRSILAASVGIALLLCLTSSGCERPKPEPDLKTQLAEQEAAAKAASAAPPKPAVELGNDPLAPYIKRAEAGEVNAMITLGRMYESKGGADALKEARKWYEKAAATGNEDAQMSLKMLDATMAAQRPATPGPGTSTEPSTPNLSSPLARSLAQEDITAASAATAPSASASANGGATTAPATPRDPSKMSWPEIVGSIDTHNFVTVANPAWRGRKGSDAPVFVGLTTAPDKGITVAATGPNGDDCHEVSMVLRLRNQQDLPDNPRVKDAATVCSTVTHGGVSLDDLAGWIKNYLMTQKKSDPIFRNGWQLKVSGTVGEGMQDPKEYLGQVVLIEMKK